VVYEAVNELTNLNLAHFPSLKRRGGCGINKKLRSHRSAAAGVVSSATYSRLYGFAELTTPAALHRNGSILLIAQPPLLFKEGKYGPIPIDSHLL
jgi:hypothetical protein